MKKKIFISLLAILIILSGGIIIRDLRLKRAEVVKVEKTSSGHYRLLIDDKPFLIKGVCYNPIPIGKSPSYDFWSDPAKPWLIDGALMKDAGINTVRFYNHSVNPKHTGKVIRGLYRRYGIRTILTHYLGFWQNPDYSDPDFKAIIYNEVIEMVKAYKDEPGVLLWLLGSENNFSFGYQKLNPWTSPELEKITDHRQRDRKKAEIYYSFVDELAAEIHKIDPEHPVALGNGDVDGLEIAGRICKNIDLLGLTSYRGKGFGNLWRQAKSRIDKPLFIAEFGCDAYNSRKEKEDQDIQAKFIESLWMDILSNSEGKQGIGNSLGGCVFEWTDEWWKYEGGSYKFHDTIATWTGYGYYYDIIDGLENHNMNEEWWGIVAIEPEMFKGVNKRMPRKAYYILKEMGRKGG